MRFAVGAVAVAVLAAASGCGSDSNDVEGRSGPNTQGVLITVLSYGRAADAKERCPLLSTGFRERAGGGDAAKCATLGARTLCPCQSERLNASSIVVNGDTATAKAIRANGSTLEFTLVREGEDWKIDAVQAGT